MRRKWLTGKYLRQIWGGTSARIRRMQSVIRHVMTVLNQSSEGEETEEELFDTQMINRIVMNPFSRSVHVGLIPKLGRRVLLGIDTVTNNLDLLSADEIVSYWSEVVDELLEQARKFTNLKKIMLWIICHHMSDTMRLDERIKQSIIDLINSKHPEWVHQEEIYTYLENELEFDERQKALHHQKAGQIEPNWQHDARNLQHSLKRNGTIINPRTDVYGLPMFEFELDYEAVWRGCLRNAESNPSCQIEPDLIIYDGVKISKSLVTKSPASSQLWRGFA